MHLNSYLQESAVIGLSKNPDIPETCIEMHKHYSLLDWLIAHKLPNNSPFPAGFKETHSLV